MSTKGNVIELEQPGAGRNLIVFGELGDYDELLQRKASSFVKLVPIFDRQKVKLQNATVDNPLAVSIKDFFLADKRPKNVLMYGYYETEQAFKDAVDADPEIMFGFADMDQDDHYVVYGVGDDLYALSFIGSDDDPTIFGFSKGEASFMTWYQASRLNYPGGWVPSEGNVRQETGVVVKVSHGILAQLDMRMFNVGHALRLKKDKALEATVLNWWNTDLLGYERHLPLTTPFTVFRSRAPKVDLKSVNPVEAPLVDGAS